MWSPAALADRGKFRERDVRLSIRDGVDHGRDDALGAEIERAAHHGECTDRDAHDRRGPCKTHLRDPGHDRRGVPQSVLCVERDRREPFARDELGHNRIGQAAPAAKDRFAGTEPAGEKELR